MTREPLHARWRDLHRLRLDDGRPLGSALVIDEVPTWWAIDWTWRERVDRMQHAGRLGSRFESSRLVAAARRFAPWPLVDRSKANDCSHRAMGLVEAAGLDVDEVARGAVLFTGQTRNWHPASPSSHGLYPDGSDIFFDDLMGLVSDRGRRIATCAPMSGARWPWPPNGADLENARGRNGPGGQVAHLPLDLGYDDEVARIRARAQRDLAKVGADLRAARSFRDLRRASAGTAFEALAKTFDGFLRIEMPRFVALVNIATRALDRWKPERFVVFSEYGRWERATVLAARSLGIPTIGCQHGVIHPHHHGYNLPREAFLGFDGDGHGAAPLPDRLALYGSAYRDLLVSWGWPADRLVVTGHPRMDRLASLPARADRPGAAPGTILWATQRQGFPHDQCVVEREAMLRSIVALSGESSTGDEVRLVWKPHPNESDADAFAESSPSWSDASRLVTMAGRSDDIFGLIRAADVVVTRDSTTAIEAGHLGTPVVVLNLSGEPDRVDYVEAGLAYGAYDEPSLASVLSGLRAGEDPLGASRKAYAESHLGPMDGASTSRWCDAALGI